MGGAGCQPLGRCLLWRCCLLCGLLPVSMGMPRLRTKPCLFPGWAGLGLARLDVAAGTPFSVSGCAHLRNGELGGLGCLITSKVNHGATLGHVVHPEAFKQLTVVQVEETAWPILHASLPVTLVAVPVLWGKGQGHVGAGHT